ncbi:MAG TPA: hypothetical protein VGQ55_16530 [Pyrinomonadaceae bacterium]|jgi:gas vesicle protein|nr:hypothetical protein [Pyrinomonadaceae bacterium]
MKSILTILGGIGIGAAIMYLLDPDRGNRRRALLRDKAVSLNTTAQKAIAGKVEDVGNRATGLLHETKSALESWRKKAEQQH